MKKVLILQEKIKRDISVAHIPGVDDSYDLFWFDYGLWWRIIDNG